MSDKLKELTPILVSFEQGESPTPSKLESSFEQISNAMDIIERAIGDLWNQSSISAGPLDLNPDYIANLSRVIGNMSKINPKSLGGNSLSVVAEAVPDDRKLFALDHAPDDPANPSAITFTNGTGVFDTLVASLADVDAAGEYFIEANGLVHTFTRTGATHTVSYDYTTVADSYSGATYNVMPTPSQTTRCTVTEITPGSQYQVTLPVDTDSGSLNYNQQLTIPGSLDALLDDDEIPAGFLYLWDNTTNSIVEGLTFKKIGAPGTSLASFNVEGAIDDSISEPNKYSAITVGTQVSSLLEAIRVYMYSHDHSDNAAEFIDHANLIGSDNPITHGVISDIVGINDPQTLREKKLYDPVMTDDTVSTNDIIMKVNGSVLSLRNYLDTDFKDLDGSCIPTDLAGYGVNVDTIDGFDATATPTDGTLMPLGTGNKFINAVLNTGHGNGIDADTIDTFHATGTPSANTLLTLDGSSKFPNSTLYTGSGNGLDSDTVDGAHLNDPGTGTSDLWSADKIATAISDGTGAFTSWQSKSYNTAYLAANDIIVIASNPGSHGGGPTGYSDTNANPVTYRTSCQGDRGAGASMAMPVRAGDYWKVTGTGTLSTLWIMNIT